MVGRKLCTPTYFGNKAEFLAWKPKFLKACLPTFRSLKMIVPICYQEAFGHFPIHSYVSAVLCPNLTSLQECESRNRKLLGFFAVSTEILHMLSRQIINITVVARYFHSNLFYLRDALLMNVTAVVVNISEYKTSNRFLQKCLETRNYYFIHRCTSSQAHFI